MFTARDVARIVGLQESRIRYWAQTGFVGPSAKANGRGVYTFQDLVGVKTAKELLDKGLTVQRVRKNLDALREQLPHVERPLAELRIVSDGDRLVVLDEETRFEPATGQLVMDFSLAPLEREVESLPRSAPTNAPGPIETAYAWFVEGQRVESEDGPDDEALIAYQKALESDPSLAAAHTNLGNLLHRRGELDEAQHHYKAALAIDPDQPEARYNLGNLYEQRGQREQAVAEWYRALAACPELADAHFNLAVAFLREGAAERARRHLERFLALDQGASDGAARAREILEQL